MHPYVIRLQSLGGTPTLAGVDWSDSLAWSYNLILRSALQRGRWPLVRSNQTYDGGSWDSSTSNVCHSPRRDPYTLCLFVPHSYLMSRYPSTFVPYVSHVLFSFFPYKKPINFLSSFLHLAMYPPLFLIGSEYFLSVRVSKNHLHYGTHNVS